MRKLFFILLLMLVLLLILRCSTTLDQLRVCACHMLMHMLVHPTPWRAGGPGCNTLMAPSERVPSLGASVGARVSGADATTMRMAMFATRANIARCAAAGARSAAAAPERATGNEVL